MDEEQTEETEKGPIAYQETKNFRSAHGLLEPHLINVYDNIPKRVVTFEIYGFDTQANLFLTYPYALFDNLFRFNAELMNPNRKEGRFHWVIERLEISTVTKERKLKLAEKPTEETSQLPLFETKRKIPTGRMDLKERQRLREQMDILDVRRAENIAKKRAVALERFLKHVFTLKEEDARRKEEQTRRMEEEKMRRYKNKEEFERQEEEEVRGLEAKSRIRRKATEAKEQRMGELKDFELAQLRLRWQASDAEKARLIESAHIRRAKERSDAKEAAAMRAKKAEEAAERRLVMWAARDGRKKQRDDLWLAGIMEQKAEIKRLAKMQKERNQEFLKEWDRHRRPVFTEQLRRTQERIAARAAEQEAVVGYHERRLIPKKPKTKGKNAKKHLVDKLGDKADATKKKKDSKKAKHDDDDEDVKPVVADVEKVLEAVENKVRAEMEEQKRREFVDKLRTDKIKAAAEARNARELAHMREVRENFRKTQEEEARVFQERHLVIQQKAAEMKAAAERKKSDKERLERLRAQNIEKKVRATLLKLTAGA